MPAVLNQFITTRSEWKILFFIRKGWWSSSGVLELVLLLKTRVNCYHTYMQTNFLLITVVFQTLQCSSHGTRYLFICFFKKREVFDSNIGCHSKKYCLQWVALNWNASSIDSLKALYFFFRNIIVIHVQEESLLIVHILIIIFF